MWLAVYAARETNRMLLLRRMTVFIVGLPPPPLLLFCRGFLIIIRRKTRWFSSGRGTSRTQGPLPGNARHSQHSQDRDNHAPSGIRVLNSSKRASAHPRFRLHGHWDRRPNDLLPIICPLAMGVFVPILRVRRIAYLF
jgi:hypothetical protein